MASLATILDEMADVIRAVSGPAVAPAQELQVVGRRNFNPTPPSIDIYPGEPFRTFPDEALAFNERAGTLFFTVRARVTTVDNLAGQDFLLRLMDEEDEISVASALMDDQTLGGLTSSISVDSNTGYRAYLEGGDEPGALLGCEWSVRVLRVIT